MPKSLAASLKKEGKQQDSSSGGVVGNSSSSISGGAAASAEVDAKLIEVGPSVSALMVGARQGSDGEGEVRGNSEEDGELVEIDRVVNVRADQHPALALLYRIQMVRGHWQGGRRTVGAPSAGSIHAVC